MFTTTATLVLALLASGQLMQGRPRAVAVGGDCTDYASLDVALMAEDWTTDVGITTWNDSSGNGNDATQTTDASEPVVSSNWSNNTDAADFDGSNDFLQFGTTLSQSGAFTIAVAIELESGTTNDFLIHGVGGGGSDSLVYVATSNGSLNVYEGGGFTRYSTTSAFSDATKYIWVLGRDGSGNLWAYQNGADISDTNTEADAVTSTTMRLSALSSGLDGRVGQLCVWGADHEASEQAIADMFNTTFSIY